MPKDESVFRRSSENCLLSLFRWVVWGPHLVMLRFYSWFCAQGLLLAMLRGPHGVLIPCNLPSPCSGSFKLDWSWVTTIEVHGGSFLFSLLICGSLHNLSFCPNISRLAFLLLQEPHVRGSSFLQTVRQIIYLGWLLPALGEPKYSPTSFSENCSQQPAGCKIKIRNLVSCLFLSLKELCESQGCGCTEGWLFARWL